MCTPRIIAACTLLVAATAAAGQEPPAVLGEVVLAPPEAGARGYLVLTDGETLLGRIVPAKPGVVAVRQPNDDVVFARASDVRGVLEVTVPFGSLPPGPKPSFVVLRDGRVFQGVVTERSGDGVVLLLASGESWTFPGHDVARVLPVTERSRVTGGSDRHLTAPSALLVPLHGLRIALVEGTDLSATMGVLQHVAVTVGTSVPVLHTEQYGGNAYGAVRAGMALGPLVRVAGGVHLRAGAAGSVQGFLSATATLDLPALDVTLHAGPMFEGADGLGQFGTTGAALAVTAPVAPQVDLVAEVWGSRHDGKSSLFTAGAVRWRVWRMAIDVGAAGELDRGPRLWLGLQLDATR